VLPQSTAAFVGLQVAPINFLDEGLERLVHDLRDRFGINALMIGTVSWLGLKVGRRVSADFEGWPDHGRNEGMNLSGGSYITPRPEFYADTVADSFRSSDPELMGIDILDAVLPVAHASGVRVFADLMEPMFRYAGHGQSEKIEIPGLARVLQIDSLGRIAPEPCINHPQFRGWLHALIEDHATNYNIDGIMWCNERRSPIDAVFSGSAAHCFCEHCTSLGTQSGVDVARARDGFEELRSFVSSPGDSSGAFVRFLSVLYRNPEILVWEKFWVERNKLLDRELYGIMKYRNSEMQFGLNVWNRNHLNPLRKAQWPWKEQAQWADWVKPIVYQHQAGGVFRDEWEPLLHTLFRNVEADTVIELVKAILNLNEGHWDNIVETGFDPDTYIADQCREVVEELDGAARVYMGIGIDAPRSHPKQAVCTPEIVAKSVFAAHRAGANGVIFGPAYSGMNLKNLEAGTRALREIGWL